MALPAVEHFKECSEVLLILRCFVMDISDQRRVQQRLRFGPELITGFAIAFGVGNQCGHELQDILLGMNVRERIVMLRLFEIDRIKNLNSIVCLYKRISDFWQCCTFWERFVKTIFMSLAK